MSTFDQVKDLPLKVEEYSLETLSFSPSPDFERLSTIIQISAGGLTGNGEDVTYDALDHIALADAGTPHDLTGPETVGEFCELIGKTDLFPAPPQVETSRQYRRWAFESAALDLALKQNSTDLSTHLGRPMLPLNFVASMRLAPFEGSSSIEPLMAKLERYPTLRFKLDAATDWDDGLLAALQSRPTPTSTSGWPSASSRPGLRIPTSPTRPAWSSSPTGTGSPGTRRSIRSVTSRRSSTSPG